MEYGRNVKKKKKMEKNWQYYCFDQTNAALVSM